MSAGDAAFLHEMREFSRLYARKIGVFRGRALGFDYSLPEARVLEEIGRAPGDWVAIELAEYLVMDRSYMTRVLNGLEKKGLLRREPAPDDARKKRLYLTELGAQEAAEIERRSDEQMQAILGDVTTAQKREMLKAVAVLEKYWK
ncbi:MAG: MarR family transcriptional regulator [Selenomonadaceae bacterium]|nr:MarR family transcriptional regulator [Selenomonadaceae bacterium]